MEICVYSVLVGKYEEINEQPIAFESNVTFTLFTDRKDLVSNSWTIKHIEPLFPLDPVRSHRKIKIQPHLFLDEYDVSLYIDNSVILKMSPEKIINRFLSENSDLVVFKHSFRKTLFDEFTNVRQLLLDNPYRIQKQLSDYKTTDSDLFDEKPFWGGFLIRRHNKKSVMSFSDIWCSHVMRYSRRDQLSINYAIKHSKVNVTVLDLDNHQTDFHKWPVSCNRDQTIRIYEPTVPLDKAIQERDSLKRQLVALQASKSWRITKPLRWTTKFLKIISVFLRKYASDITTSMTKHTV